MNKYYSQIFPEKKEEEIDSLLQDLSIRIKEDVTNSKSDASIWLERRKLFLSQYDNLLGSNKTGLFSRSSNVHIPITEINANAIHSRLFQSLIDIRPPFYVRARKDEYAKKVDIVEGLMLYTINDFMNYGKGIWETIDAWVRDGVVEGDGIIKLNWDTQITKYKTKVENPDTGKEERQEVTKLKFDGPVIKRINAEDFFMPDGYEDIDQCPFVWYKYFLDENALRAKAFSEFFEQDVVDELLKRHAGEYNQGANGADKTIKELKDLYAGIKTVNAKSNRSMFEIIEWYGKYDIDNDGTDEEIIVWFNTDCNIVLKWEYLDEVYSSGMRPFFKWGFRPRPGRARSIGLAELLYSPSAELDAIHNQRLDFGTITNLPFFVYRASSNLEPQELHIEPGIGYPVDDVNDIKFMTTPNSTSWGFQEEALVNSYIERLTSISDLALGRVPQKIGGTRTATGTMAVLNEANIQIDVYIRRLRNAYSRLLQGIFRLMRDNMPPGFVFRVTGDIGESLFKTIDNKQDIAGDYDFEIIANSVNTNKQIEKDNSILLAQLLVTPLNLQTGRVTQENVYNLYKNICIKHEIPDISLFITPPKEPEQPVSFAHAILLMAMGEEVKVGPQDNHAENLEKLQEFINSDDSVMFPEMNKRLLLKYKKDNELMLQSMQNGSTPFNLSGLPIAPQTMQGYQKGGVQSKTYQQNIPEITPIQEPLTNYLGENAKNVRIGQGGKI